MIVSYVQFRKGLQEIILDLIKLIILPISLIYKLIYKIFKIK